MKKPGSKKVSRPRMNKSIAEFQEACFEYCDTMDQTRPRLGHCRKLDVKRAQALLGAVMDQERVAFNRALRAAVGVMLDPAVNGKLVISEGDVT